MLGPPVDLLTFQCVDAIGRPDPVGALQDLEVDARTPRSAGLDFQAGTHRTQLIHQPVGGQGLCVHGRTPGTGRPRVHQVTVVVPLEVVDLVASQDLAQLVAHLGVGLRDGQVQHLLVAGLDGQPSARLHHPLRVRSGEI